MKHDALEGLAQALFEESGDALFLFDPETEQFLDVNSTAQRLTGFPLRELLGMPVTSLFRFEGPAGLSRLLQAARKTQVFHSQEGYLLRTVSENNWVPVNLTVARLHVKPKSLGLITARDVRDQHAGQRRLKELEAELRRVLAAVDECLWTAEIDKAGQWVYRSFAPTVEKITGQPPEFFQEGVHRWWGLVHRDDQSRWAKAFASLRSGQSVREEYRIVGPDEKVRTVSETVEVELTNEPAGRVLRLRGVIRDLTELRQTQAALRQAEERLHALTADAGRPLSLVQG